MHSSHDRGLLPLGKFGHAPDIQVELGGLCGSARAKPYGSLSMVCRWSAYHFAPLGHRRSYPILEVATLTAKSATRRGFVLKQIPAHRLTSHFYYHAAS